MSTVPPSLATEWLETDGLGGFSSGTTASINTRRYHALLLAAENPPSDRRVLLNDVAAWLETPNGVKHLSRHSFTPDVLAEGSVTPTGFESEPWPRFSYDLEGTTLEREIVLLSGLPIVLTRYRMDKPMPGARLCVRPLLSGRDFHALQHENATFDFAARVEGDRVAFRPYRSVTGVIALVNGTYRHEPVWYRNFQYDSERARGLDFVEDLGSPGVFELAPGEREASLVFAADTEATRAFLGNRSASAVATDIVARERARRSAFPSPLHRAADAYVVRRGNGRTVVAGYPWFGDWGRDTFIALRGLCLSTGRLALAKEILLEWANAVSFGMLPNRFADRADDAPEYNSVDAALWFVACVGELLARDASPSPAERREFADAVQSIIDGHLRGTRHGIRVDGDGLLAAGERGVQLTWMDAKIGDYVVTPRVGKPVEIQALWLNALAVAEQFVGGQGIVLRRGAEAFLRKFMDSTGGLYDVVDVDHERGKVDASVRPNQVLAAGGLPFTALSTEHCRRVLDVVERQLWTPFGLRSLAPEDAAYRPYYRGGVYERDSGYHQGTVWPWLAGPFIEAWVRSRGGSAEAKQTARARFLEPLKRALEVAGVGHLPEVTDGDFPHLAGGCPFQAWSVAELLRLELDVLADRSVWQSPPRRTA